MRVSTIRTADGTRAARIEGDELIALPFEDVGALLREPDWERTAARTDGARTPLAGADFAPLVVRPGKIICLGLNYKAHIVEMGREIPEHPTLFAKYTNALIGARDDIILPPESAQVDWEVELAFVIGRSVRRARGADAAAAIAGFTVLNDISMRDWQFRSLQFLQGKTFEKSTPVGPALVTVDEIGISDPDLLIQCEVDGEVMQSARTVDLLFPPTFLVEYISTLITLEPGDIIATGTPSGVGVGRNPTVFLRDGQVVRTTIQGIGELVNACAAEKVPS